MAKIKHKDQEFTVLGFLLRGTNIVRIITTAIVCGFGWYLIRYGKNASVETKWVTLSSDMAILIVIILGIVVLPDIPKYIAAWRGNKQ